MAAVEMKIDKADLRRLQKQLDRLSIKQQKKEVTKILSNASLPIRKAAKNEAKAKIKPNSGFIFKRGGTEYEIKPNTIEKSIKALKYKQSKGILVDVGYKAGGSGKYDGWFAHFVDDGTKQRETDSGAKRGAVKPRNIMEGGKKGMSAAENKISKDISRMIKRLNK